MKKNFESNIDFLLESPGEPRMTNRVGLQHTYLVAMKQALCVGAWLLESSFCKIIR